MHSDIRARILKAIEQNGGLTISDVSRTLGIHYTTASKYLAVMEAEKLVTHRQIGMAKLFAPNNGFKAGRLLTIFLAFTVAFSFTAYAVPQKIPINGRLTFLNDTVVNSTANFTFSIFTARTGGTIQWNETQENLSVQNGAFSALLGNKTAINLSFDTDLFLQVTVNNEVISPRFELGSVPYAYTANQTNFTKSNARALGDFLPNTDNSYNLGSALLRWAAGFFANLNATGYVNASEVEIRGANANLTRWRSGTAPLAALNSTGGLELTGGLRVTTLNAGSCDLKADGSGNFYCGTDATGGGGNTGWTTTASAVYNDTAGVNVTIGTQNIASGYIMSIFGGLNVTQKINATELWISRTDVTLNLSRLNVSATLLEARQANDNTTLGNRQIATTYPLQGGGNLQADRTLTFDNTSYDNLDTRQKNDNQSVARTNVGNTFTGKQLFVDINVSTVGNFTNITLPVLGQCTTSLETNSIGQIICGTDPTVVTSVNTLTGAILLRGTSMINITGNSTDVVFSYVNTSLESLDIRQRADNASVARTNVQNTFSASQIVQGSLNATTFINATEVWASSRFNGSIDCKYITGGSDSDFCADATGAGGGNTGWTTSASAVYNDTSGVSVLIGSQNTASGFNTVITGNLNVTGKINATNLTATNIWLNIAPVLINSYRLMVGGDVNVTGHINASRLLVRGNSDANITVWESNSGAAVASINRTGNATFAGLRIPNLPNCDTIDTDGSGVLRCGSDATGGGGGNGGNQSGINRTLTVRLASANNSINFELPIDSNIITVKGRINGTSAATVLNITFNGDNQTNYATWRVTTTTASSSTSARSITPETTTSALNRSFEFVIYDARARRGVSGGSFQVVQHAIAASTAPVRVEGGWSWVNLTQTTGITQINIRANPGSNFLPGTWLIVNSERM